MKITIDLIPGLPKKELVEKIHYYHRQGQIAERALGFYLFDLQKSKQYRPSEDAAAWAVKHLDKVQRPDKLILLAKRLEELTDIEAAFHSGEIPWTKIREIARIAKPDTQQVWLATARRMTSRELEAEVTGKKRGDRPGGGLKARRTKTVVEVKLSGEERAVWDLGIRLIRRQKRELTPHGAAMEIFRRFIAGQSAAGKGKSPSSVPDVVVFHRWPDGRSLVDTAEGRLEVDPRIIDEKIRAGVRTIEVREVEGPGICTAIRFGEKGKVAPEDRDAKVSPELKEAVVARDGRCIVCGRTEDLSPHHLDSHADGGKSDMTRLVTLCLAQCQGLVHQGDVTLRVEEDGTVTALDRDGNVIGKPRTAAEVLAEAEEAPLEVIDRHGPAAPEPAPEDLPALDSLEDLPPELTARQWRALEGQLEWNANHRAFLFRPDGRPLAEILEAREEVQTSPSGEGPAAPGVRPASFDEFVGQRRVVDNLLLAARAAKERGEPLGHVLLSGQAGIGKTTVGRPLAQECGAGMEEVFAGNIETPPKLLSLLAGLRKGRIFFVDELHGLPKACQEFLYPALEDRVVDVVLREGGRTRALRVRLEPFTLVGATTEMGTLSRPFRDRFPLRERLEPYGEEDLAAVVSKAAERLGAPASPEAAHGVARRSKGTPREAIRILERTRDIAQLSGSRAIGLAHVDQAAERLGIDSWGLDRDDRRALKLLLRRGRPTGIKSIAAKLGLDLETYQDVHEPWLERAGLIERTPEGRVATQKARELYGVRVMN